MNWIVGLTGGIGSGKSAVADAFAARGAALVDTDVIAHQLTAPGGAAIEPLRAAFGADFITTAGALDRARMRQRVFGDEEARRGLEGVLHPLIRAESERQCREARAPYVVLVVPLLVESGSYRERCQRICVVDCPEALQIERVMRRNGLSAAEVGRIMQAQASRAQRLATADDVIDNSGPLSEVIPQVARLDILYRGLAARAQA